MTRRHLLRWGAVLLLPVLVFAAAWLQARGRWMRLAQEFEDYSGTRLVFDRSELPCALYYDSMPALSTWRRVPAAEICLREAQKYPPGYLGKTGLKVIGVFAACIGQRSDGFHSFDEELGGYFYYGIWNYSDACAVAYYSDHQLPITFHHEIFHHLDAVCDRRAGTERDPGHERYRQALAGTHPYPPPAIRPVDLAELKRVSEGELLEGAVNDYAEKDAEEDQAEAARCLMTGLADALVQAVERPDLPGSQRILYCLRTYREAVQDGPDTDWFVDVALGRISGTR